VQLLSGLHFYDSVKYVTMTSHSAIYLTVELSKKWYESLPPDLQVIVDRDAAREAVAINPQAVDILNGARKTWVNNGGELINLPPEEQVGMLKTLSSVGEDIAANKPTIKEAYQIVKEAADRLK
jgi:TRAP-type C4-dicarboxylate transport system substrate-binding protein